MNVTPTITDSYEVKDDGTVIRIRRTVLVDDHGVVIGNRNEDRLVVTPKDENFAGESRLTKAVIAGARNVYALGTWDAKRAEAGLEDMDEAARAKAEARIATLLEAVASEDEAAITAAREALQAEMEKTVEEARR